MPELTGAEREPSRVVTGGGALLVAKSTGYGKIDMAGAQQPKFKRALLLVNPSASRYQAASAVVRAGLGKTMQIDERDTRTTDLHEMLTRCPEAYDAVFVAGGDGTINYLLKDLAGAEIPLGIIPLGTANDFARTLGIPTDPALAVEALIEGETHRVDLGSVNGRYFANVASVGLGADVAREMDSNEKSWLGLLSYPIALFRAYRSAKPLKVRLTIDGDVRKQRVLQLGVGNGHSHGGGLYVSETVSVTDGKFDVYCVLPRSPWRLTSIVNALLRRQHHGDPDIKTFSAEHIAVDTSREMDVNVDGELLTTTPARFQMHARALNVLTPSGWKG